MPERSATCRMGVMSGAASLMITCCSPQSAQRKTISPAAEASTGLRVAGMPGAEVDYGLVAVQQDRKSLPVEFVSPSSRFPTRAAEWL